MKEKQIFIYSFYFLLLGVNEFDDCLQFVNPATNRGFQTENFLVKKKKSNEQTTDICPDQINVKSVPFFS